ncbi:MAG: Do family serine endopeptidase [Saprospiraceae bacterium]
MRKYLLLAAMAIGGGLTALLGVRLMDNQNTSFANASHATVPVKYAHYTPGGNGSAVADFTFAAEKALPMVVHISASMHMKRNGNSMQGFGFGNIPEEFRQFFEGPGLRFSPGDDGADQVQQGTGSGVILSADGYIVTNNHVVREADELTVTLNDKREFKAKVIGTDPSTDLALVKIEAKDLPYIQFGNSDEAKVGEWVVAIGNPFNLASTVTAGIVSAKGRDIHIVQDKAPIESFIQTDAVVNPGNSGGALLNLDGSLIGINTAIASPTGVYAGYAFAIPSNLVQKVVEDLRQFGVVQRGYLGIIIRDQAKEGEDKLLTGVIVDSLVEKSAAREAGIKKGDVITKIDDQQIKSSPELLEIVGKHRPGDKLKLYVQRNGSERDYTVVLKNRSGNTDKVVKPVGSAAMDALGAEFETLSKAEAKKLDIKGGVQVKSMSMGKLSNQTDIREGFIITSVNNQFVTDLESFQDILNEAKGGVMLEGIYPANPDRQYYYAFGI